MLNKLISYTILLSFICTGVLAPRVKDAKAGVLFKSAAKVAARKAARRTAAKSSRKQAARKRAVVKKKKNLKERRAREHSRDNKTMAKPLEKDRTVRRYTSMKEARAIQKNGVPPRTHMTARVPKGRPISAKTAKERYGLEKIPEARVTIRVPKGHPVKLNKAMYNKKGGWGELTSPKHNPPNNVLGVKRVH